MEGMAGSGVVVWHHHAGPVRCVVVRKGNAAMCVYNWLWCGVQIRTRRYTVEGGVWQQCVG